MQGDFSILLPPQEALESAQLRIEGSCGDSVLLEDVDIGEVWIAGGQSNMEFLMEFESHYKQERKTAHDPHLRFFDVPEYSFAGEELEPFKSFRHWGQWYSATRKNMKYFSAVGYFFAKELRELYKVPVAIVGCNWGGTTASSWMNRETLENDPILKVYVDEYDAGLQTLDLSVCEAENYVARKFAATPSYRYFDRKLLRGNTGPISNMVYKMVTDKPPKPLDHQHPNRPGGLYQTMLKKIIGFGSRGVIWYQGESDVHHADIYSHLFGTMIDFWRSQWQDELPFLYVQLAPFGHWLSLDGELYPKLRQQQEMVMRTKEKCYMASIMDAGMEADIHPKNKKIVGERLALLARGHVYGEDALLCDPPYAEKVEKDGRHIRIRMKNAGTGLLFNGEPKRAICVWTGDVQCENFSVYVAKDTVIIALAQAVEQPVTVTYAWTSYCEANLYNSSKLCAAPFRVQI